MRAAPGGDPALAARPWRLVRRVYYRLQLRLPLDDGLAVYAAYWYRGFSCNPRAVYLAARELAPEVRGVWVVRPDADVELPRDVDVVRTGTFGYYRAIARAKYLVNNVNFPNEIVKRPGQVHLQTHHGTPLKTMGVDLQALRSGLVGMDFEALLLRCDRWDYSVSSNAFSSEAWEHAYPASYQALEAGYPRNDRLFGVPDDEVGPLSAPRWASAATAQSCSTCRPTVSTRWATSRRPTWRSRGGAWGRST